MRKRELLTGFGAGILVATAIIGLTAPKPISVSTSMTENEIKEAAKALEMVVLNKEEYDQWQGEKKVDVKPAATPPTAPQKPAVEKVVTPQVNNAKTPSVQAPEASSPAAAPTTQPATQAPPPQAVEATQTPTAPAAPKKASFTVPYKATAEKVAQILVDEKVLPADNTFVEELRSQNKLNRIRVGTYELPVPTTEEEIVKLITTPPKK
jgi:hypothetical protein